MTNSLVTTTRPTPNEPKKNKGGRPKGSRNRSSFLLQDEIEKMFGTKNFDPVIFLASIAADATKPVEVRIVAASKAAPYLHSPAKPAIVDDTGKKKPVNVEALMGKIARDLMLEGKVKLHDEVTIDDDVEDVEPGDEMDDPDEAPDA